jgi:plasmid stability protein
MAQMLVRDIDPEVLDRLKEQARRNGRSLQGEVKAILEAAAPMTLDEARRHSDHWRRQLAGRMTSASPDLIREDRER